MSQSDIIKYFLKNDNVYATSKEIAKSMNTHPANIANNLRRLRKHKDVRVIIRKDENTRGRRYFYKLSKKGLERYGKIRQRR